MAVGIGTVTQGTLASGINAVTTVSFTSTNQPLYVIVPYWASTQTLNSVTYGGTALTRVLQSGLSNAQDRVEIWRLLSPTAGTANLVLTMSNNSPAGTVAIFNTTGQDTGTPEGTPATNVSTVNGTGTGSLSLTGAATGDLVIAGIAAGAATAITPANTGGTGLTEYMDVAASGEQSEAFRVSDACTAVSGSWVTSTSWAVGAIALKAIASGATTPLPPYRRRIIRLPAAA